MSTTRDIIISNILTKLANSEFDLELLYNSSLIVHDNEYLLRLLQRYTLTSDFDKKNQIEEQIRNWVNVYRKS